MTVTRLMLGRRPDVGMQQRAFGHVALRDDAQKEVEAVVAGIAAQALSLTKVTYDPDDAPGDSEVMTHALTGIDTEFQPAARWSLERAAKEIAKRGRPAVISKSELLDGDWTFYVLRASIDGKAATVIRATSPTRALKHGKRVITQFLGGELRPMKDPLIAVDRTGDAVIIDGIVYIFKPQTLERLLIDAEEVKSRAPQIAAKFTSGVAASLSATTGTWVAKACSNNSNVGRRVERLNRNADLGSMTARKLRAGLRDAKLSKDTFGTDSVIEVATLDHAVALIDIAADLYYQPRFEKTSRRVASFRRL